ncbi:MAG TPA: hypothetical protein VK066_13970 [Chloroflexota bacterium]|nr:hypothetical protein [Chloroflexota bacterium]
MITAPAPTFRARCRYWALAVLLLLGLVGWLPARPALAQQAGAVPDDAWQRRDTTYFTIYYTAADRDALERYATVVDSLYEYVAAAFDHGPTPPVPLRLYPTTRAYASVNPIARYVEGVIAHTDTHAGEIGIAVDRVDRAGAETLRDTVRHELMHLTLTELTADRLPIGFQEGIAQYAEKEATDRRRLAESLRTAERQGQLLSWEDLNDQPRFLRRMNVGYPEALSMMTFLVDRHGLGTLKRFLLELGRRDEPYDQALAAVYGEPAAALETEWREYLPTYYASGWESNQLRTLDLADAKERFAAGDYAAAQPLFEQAQRLHTELEQPARAAEAAGYLGRVAVALEAADLAQQGRAQLAERDYSGARALLAAAEQRYDQAGDAARRAALAEPLAQAENGATAGEQLAAAEALVAGWRYPEGRARSAEAAALYQTIGDEDGVQRAQAVRAEADNRQGRLALLLLSAGAVALVGLVLRPRRAPRPGAPPTQRADEGFAL